MHPANPDRHCGWPWRAGRPFGRRKTEDGRRETGDGRRTKRNNEVVIPGMRRATRDAEPGTAFQSRSRLQSPSMDFALRANLRLSKFVPDEFVRIAASRRPE